MNTKELYDYLPYLPIADLDDSCIATKRGDITFGWRLLLPTAYTVTEAGYDSILHSFSQAYGLLPDYTIIHKQDIFRYDIYQPQERGEYLMNCYEKHFKGRQYLNGYCYIFITFSSKSIIEQKTPSSGFFRMLSSKAPKREDIEHYATIASQFEAVLGNNSLLTLIPLKARDYVYMDENGMDRGLIPDYLRFYSNNLNIDYPIEFNPSYISSGDTIAKVYRGQQRISFDGQFGLPNQINVCLNRHISFRRLADRVSVKDSAYSQQIYSHTSAQGDCEGVGYEAKDNDLIQSLFRFLPY